MRYNILFYLIKLIRSIVHRDNSNNNGEIGFCPNADFEKDEYILRGACNCRACNNKAITDYVHVKKYCEKHYTKCKFYCGAIPKF